MDGNMKNKNTTDGFHQLSKTCLTHIWLWLEIPGVERAYLSALVISGGCRCISAVRKWVTSEAYECWRGLAVLHAGDEWGTGLRIYLDFAAERAPHTEQRQRHSSLIRAALQLIEQDIQGQTPRVRSSESWGWILRSAPRAGGILLAKTTRPL